MSVSSRFYWLKNICKILIDNISGWRGFRGVKYLSRVWLALSKTYILNILFHKRIRDISAIKLRKLAFPFFRHKLFSRPHCSSHISTVLNLGKKLKTMVQRPRAPLMVRNNYYISVPDLLRIIPLKVVKLKNKWHICVEDWILHKLSTHSLCCVKNIFLFSH